ncbi:serine/threonine-protein kinase [Limnoraphis robusta]|uniref:Serine/threonine-protein kinase n=1 Tax=Limnoraphis robusta CCNP1315 TaxID=3110306 RepID=A0ABU5U7H5_9CYAN|nr:serine/threonine-protein kinase [Limnoraphis robusta]MEA5523163.1 serine/threonine-protein kinase [Limnoraphis robusta CCNP1315]MEA5544752.1 serine/threonine-protein kinase [Limnoraphis robusta CCNP1324]
MKCCINPQCPKPQNPDNVIYCQACGVKIPDLLRGRFRIIKLLGQGGFGRTYLAEDNDKLKEYCVVKQFVPSVQGTAALQKAIELFEREARQLQQLGKHDQIPTLSAYFEDNNQLYLVQEYVEGENLSELLEQQGVWNEKQVKDLLLSLLPVIEFIHQKNVIHRDIKPENIIRRREDGQFVLLDFGVAKELSKTVLSTQIGTQIGSLGYAPIEQMLGGEAYPASDLFSLGVTCFHLLTDVHPYELFVRQGYSWTGNWRTSLKGSVSQELGEILDKLLQEDLKNRFSSVAEVLQAFKNQSPVSPQPKVVQTSPISASKNQSPVSPQPKVVQTSPIYWQNPTLVATLKGHSNIVNSVAFSPDGRTLASGSIDNTIKLWDVQTQREIATLTGHSCIVSSVAISPDGRTLASGSNDTTIKLWDVQTQREIATLTGHSRSVISVAFSPDGRTLVSGSRDKTIRLWDVQTQGEIATLTGHLDIVMSVAFSPDSRTLASGSYDHTIKLWDVQTQGEIATLTRHSDHVNSVAFSPDGRTLASGSDDKTIKLWDVPTRREIATLGEHPDWASPDVFSVAFSPDGRTLAIGSRNPTISLWDVQTRRRIPRMTLHSGSIFSVAFSPDGRTLACGISDKTITLWLEW